MKTTNTAKTIIIMMFIILTAIISVLGYNNYKLSTELSKLRVEYDNLNSTYECTINDYTELNNMYDNLTEGLYNKANKNVYEYTFEYDGTTYTYSGNGKMFGESCVKSTGLEVCK